jgi:hypothetical protein
MSFRGQTGAKNVTRAAVWLFVGQILELLRRCAWSRARKLALLGPDAGDLPWLLGSTDHAGDVVGVDHDERHVCLARERYPGATLEHGDVATSARARGPFDVAFLDFTGTARSTINTTESVIRYGTRDRSVVVVQYQAGRERRAYDLRRLRDAKALVVGDGSPVVSSRNLILNVDLNRRLVPSKIAVVRVADIHYHSGDNENGGSPMGGVVFVVVRGSLRSSKQVFVAECLRHERDLRQRGRESYAKLVGGTGEPTSTAHDHIPVIRPSRVANPATLHREILLGIGEKHGEKAQRALAAALDVEASLPAWKAHATRGTYAKEGADAL